MLGGKGQRDVEFVSLSQGRKGRISLGGETPGSQTTEVVIERVIAAIMAS